MLRVAKKDLIIEISDKTGMKHEDVSRVVEGFLGGIAKHLGQGHSVALREFGTFELRVSRRKVGRNPKQPDVTIHIPDRTVVRFRPGQSLEESVAAVPLPD